MLIMFRISVITNSTVPTAKIVSYFDRPLGDLAGRGGRDVRRHRLDDWSGSKVRFGVLPAARTTIIVSPTAREIARTIEATIPESAAGKTTRGRDPHLGRAHRIGALAQSTRHRAHRVLGDRGDDRHDHQPIPTPAASARKIGALVASFWMSSGVMKVTAKKPIATVGMPARTSSVGLITLRTRGLAYSLR